MIFENVILDITFATVTSRLEHRIIICGKDHFQKNYLQKILLLSSSVYCCLYHRAPVYCCFVHLNILISCKHYRPHVYVLYDNCKRTVENICIS